MDHSPELFLRGSIALTGLGGLLSSLEFLSLRGMFRAGGVLAWDTESLRPRQRRLRPVLRFCAPVFRWPAIVGLLGARVAFAAGCIAVAATGGTIWPWLAGFAIASMLFFLRTPDLLDGAEQMMTLISLACLIAEIVNTNFARSVALLFLGAQLSLVYLTAGASKALNPAWRDGTVLRGLFSTASFGRHFAFRLIERYSNLGLWLSWMVFAGEITASIAPWTSLPVCAVLLASALAFHIAAAFVMGLNTFVFAFAAAYPAAVYCSTLLHKT